MVMVKSNLKFKRVAIGLNYFTNVVESGFYKFLISKLSYSILVLVDVVKYEMIGY